MMSKIFAALLHRHQGFNSFMIHHRSQFATAMNKRAIGRVSKIFKIKKHYIYFPCVKPDAFVLRVTCP